MSHSPGRNDLTTLRITTLLSATESAFRLMSFWTAILLPFVYVPLTVVDHHWMIAFPNFLAVVTLHVIAILGGMEHQAFDQRL